MVTGCRGMADPWLSVEWCRRHRARGDVIIVRFADDFIYGLQQDAQRFLADLHQRLGKFGLELHPDKTRLTEFGRFAARNRAARGLGKPETFAFLVFTHLCAATQSGWFRLKRITIAKRPRASLREVREQLRKRVHQPIPAQGRWLASVVRGHMAYYAVPGNVQAVAAFHAQGDPAPAQDAAAPQSAHHDHLGADGPDRDPVATTRPRHAASLPERAL